MARVLALVVHRPEGPQLCGGRSPEVSAAPHRWRSPRELTKLNPYDPAEMSIDRSSRAAARFLPGLCGGHFETVARPSHRAIVP